MNEASGLWRLDSENESMIESGNGIHIASVQNEDDARRIVACVNACSGISNEELEAIAQDDSTDALNELLVQRDELLAAIEPLAELCDNLCRWDRRFDDALDAVDAAVAKAKGEQKPIDQCAECKSMSPVTTSMCKKCEDATPAFTEAAISFLKGSAK
jgi:hypothetical protein